MSTRQAESNKRRRRGECKPHVTATPAIIAMLIEDGDLHPDLKNDPKAVGKAMERCLAYYASQPPA